MSKLLQKIASEKLTPGGGETVLTGKRKRNTEQEEAVVTTKAKVNSSLRPISGGKSDKKKGRNVGKNEESAIVYLGHIPKGFEEEEIEGFFSQFGEVKRTKVFRNVKTNNIRGYAFIEFDTAEVAEVAAEAIDGYFLNDRKLVCHVIPPEKIHRGMFARPELTILDDILYSLDMDMLVGNDDDVEEEKLTVEIAQKKLLKHKNEMKKRQEKLRRLGYDFEISIPDVAIPNQLNTTSSGPAVTPSIKKNRRTEAVVEESAPATATKSSKKRKATEALVEETPVPASITAVPEVVEPPQTVEKKKTAKSAPPTPATSTKPSKTPAKEAAVAPVTAPAPEVQENKKASKLQKISATKSKVVEAAPVPVAVAPSSASKSDKTSSSKIPKIPKASKK